MPRFVWLAKGSRIDDAHESAAFDNQMALENWVWSLLKVVVEFHNQHTNSVQMWWVDGNRAAPKGEVIPPGTAKHSQQQQPDPSPAGTQLSSLSCRRSVVACAGGKGGHTAHLTHE